MRLSSLLAILVLTTAVSAQEHTARIVEVLPNDQFIVEIGGKQYRALPPTKVEELANQKDELKVCKENEGRNLQRIELASRDVKIAEQQTAIEHGNFVRVMALYEKERELRIETMGMLIPHGKPKGFAGFLLKAMDSPYFQFAVKVAAPIKILVTK